MCKLWLDVCSKIATLNTDGTRLARVDLNHEDYDNKETEVSTPASKRSRASSNESWQRPDQTPLTPSGTFGSEEEGELPESGTSGPEVPRDRTYHQPIPFDQVDNTLGPLTMVRRVSGPKTCQKITHLLTPEGRAIGCGWLPSPDKFQGLTEHDIKGEPRAYSCCSKCFRLYTWPTSWRMQHGATSLLDEDSSSSCGSLTDDSVDAASEDEQADFT